MQLFCCNDLLCAIISLQKVTKAMPKAESSSKTRIQFDLADELTPEEIAAFEAAAAEAGAASITEHFLNLTLRVQPTKAA